ncbi:precorrin-6A reductase [bacterium]|nr:precorrin-6A reductase [bacterium]
MAQQPATDQTGRARRAGVAGAPIVTDPRQIELTSMRTIAGELGAQADRFAPAELAVVERVIHATADFSFADTLTFAHDAVERGLAALRAGATVVTDTNMALAGVSKASLAALGCEARCFMADEGVAREARARGVTRAVVSMERACELDGPLVFAIGNAPTALLRLAELIDEGRVRPALVIGVPVGFVNVVESKERVLGCDVPAIVARGRKGGSTVAAAICNALLYQVARPGWGPSEGAVAPGDTHAADGAPRDDAERAACALVRGADPDGVVAVFAGTTEGRRLCAALAGEGRAVRAFVATAYGRAMLDDLAGVDVRPGRLDAAEMARQVAGCALVVDATHPYAAAASENIRAAAREAGVGCVRLLRPATALPPEAIVVRDASEAARVVAAGEGPVLVTTGSKEIGAFACVRDRARLHARVLPTAAALQACAQAGVPVANVICMQGPVSREMNVATLRETGARWLVTKDSGVEGGVPEKLAAARACGVMPVVIARPPEPAGTLSLAQVLRAFGARP